MPILAILLLIVSIVAVFCAIWFRGTSHIETPPATIIPTATITPSSSTPDLVFYVDKVEEIFIGSTENFIVPQYTTRVLLKVVGGGGGGGTGGSGASGEYNGSVYASGGGGSSGGNASVVETEINVVPGDVLHIQIGEGGDSNTPGTDTVVILGTEGTEILVHGPGGPAGVSGADANEFSGAGGVHPLSSGGNGSAGAEAISKTTYEEEMVKYEVALHELKTNLESYSCTNDGIWNPDPPELCITYKNELTALEAAQATYSNLINSGLPGGERGPTSPEVVSTRGMGGVGGNGGKGQGASTIAASSAGAPGDRGTDGGVWLTIYTKVPQ